MKNQKKVDNVLETKANEIQKEVETTNELLNQLNAIGITDQLKSKGAKSIFKKDFNNKADRTKCRNAFQNSISLYLLHLAKDKKDLADAELIKIKGIAEKYYLAEISFKNVSDYATDNMDANKKGLIELFINQYNKELIAA